MTLWSCGHTVTSVRFHPNVYLEGGKKSLPVIPGINSTPGAMIYAGSIGTQIANELMDFNRCGVRTFYRCTIWLGEQLFSYCSSNVLPVMQQNVRISWKAWCVFCFFFASREHFISLLCCFVAHFIKYLHPNLILHLSVFWFRLFRMSVSYNSC